MAFSCIAFFYILLVTFLSLYISNIVVCFVYFCFNCVNYVFLLLWLCILIVMHVLFYVFCFIVFFCALFVCKCVIYYCHRVQTQSQLTNTSYIISYHITWIGTSVRKPGKKSSWIGHNVNMFSSLPVKHKHTVHVSMWQQNTTSIQIPKHYQRVLSGVHRPRPTHEQFKTNKTS
jgi:hypothetical protein